METNRSTERTRIEERIKEQKWFRLLPSYTKKNLLDLPESYLVLLLEQEVVIVTTSNESDFTFGYNMEGKAVVRIPEFSASNIGVAKLLNLKLYPKEKIRFIIENISLLERPLSDKNKKRIKKLLEKIGEESLWELGSLVEEKLRDIQLRERTGRFITPCLPGLKVDRNEEARRPEIMLENHSWLWQQIAICGLVRMHLFASLWKDNIPPIIYQIDCDCNKSTVVEAIGPFSALKIAKSFPIDNPERYGFWSHRWGCRTTADEYC